MPGEQTPKTVLSKVPVAVMRRGLFVFKLDNVRDFLLHNAAGEAGLAAGAVGDVPGGEGEECVVAADCYIFPCLYFCAALADDNHSGARRRAIGELYAEIFWIRITQVFY
jgi:hypothetical protein